MPYLKATSTTWLPRNQAWGHPHCLLLDPVLHQQQLLAGRRILLVQALPMRPLLGPI